MQTYGFWRIYDAKASATAASRARVDIAFCVAWFLAGVLLSPLRSALDLCYESGGPVIATWVITALRSGIVALLAAVTVLFIWR